MKHFENEILLLQGGGALGAYQAGVFAGLTEAGLEPTWIVGISIGAINAALIAGNPPARRVERLGEFWRLVSSASPFAVPAALAPLRPALNTLSAMSAATFGVPGFFRPRVPPAWFAPEASDEALGVYDTRPLRATLERLVDFDLINSARVRLSLGAVNVRTGASVYFDNRITRIGPEHVMASGALPPGFPPVTIDGERYWDGGVLSNSPHTYVWEERRSLRVARVVAVDIFNPEGEIPRSLGEVSEREKDIRYASRAKNDLRHVTEIGELQATFKRLVEKLPADLRADPDVERLCAVSEDVNWTIVRQLNTRPSRSGQVKDYEFSRATVDEAWYGGLDDVRRARGAWDRMRPRDLAPGVSVYNLPFDLEALQTPTEAPPAPAPRDGRRRKVATAHRSGSDTRGE